MNERRFRRLVFWQNIASHHQAGVLIGLAREFNFEVLWVVGEGMSEDRAAMGWPEFEDQGVELVVAPNVEKIEELIDDRIDHSLHVVSGVFRNAIARSALIRGHARGGNFMLLNEAPMPADAETTRASLKARAMNHLMDWGQIGLRNWYGDEILGALCIGGLAEKAYTRFGWLDKVIPYGYFPPGPGCDFQVKVPEGSYKILYLGQFTHRKGVDVLVEGLGKLRTGRWNAKFFGEGVLRDKCEAIVSQSSVKHKIEFHGYLNWSAAMDEIASSDLLVVPSRHDGWGAVVGESIMRGVPVVTTDRTGSAVLLKDGWRGGVVKAGDSSALAAEIDRWVAQGRLKLEDRKRIYEWGRRLEPENAARYFAEVIRWIEGGDRPVAPWLCD